MRALMPAAMICLSSCVPAGYSPGCPVYPAAGEKVAAELEKSVMTRRRTFGSGWGG